MFFFRTVFILIFAAHPFAHAVADSFGVNRQIIPIGESEAFLGNAGVGRAQDTGAVFYNPAGLVDLGTGRVSMSGSVYLSFRTKTDGLIRLDDRDVPYEASGFNTIPGFYVATYRLSETWNGALSVLVPNSIQVENRVAFTTPNTAGNIVQNFRSSDLWLGLSLAHRLDERWSLGLSIYGIQHQETQSAALDVGFPAAPNNAVTSLTQQSLGVFGFSAILGAVFKATDWLELGLRAQSPLVKVKGSADTFKLGHEVVNGKVTTTSEDLKDNSAAYQLPVDFTLGSAWTPAEWFAFLADVSLQHCTHYDSIPASSMSDAINLKPTPRFNFGMEFRPARQFPIRTGFYYNPSANGTDSAQPGYIAEDYYGVTAGVGFKSTRVETGVGAFYIWSSGRTVPINGTGAVLDVHSHGVGALLTTSYLL